MPDGLPKPRRYWSVLAIALTLVVAILDSAIANVALPSIARDLNASPAASIWVVNAYNIAVVICLLPLAALGEIVGFRRVYQTGLAIFTVASLACVLAHSILTLSLSRVLQGLGAGAILSVNPALVRLTYPRAMLGRAIGLNALIVSLAAAAGPTLAGAILAIGQWRWLFALNLPIGLVALAIASFALPANPLRKHRIDWTGSVLTAAAFGLVISGLQSAAHGAAQPLAILMLAAGLAAGVALVWQQRGRLFPMIPIDLLAKPMFTVSVVTSMIAFMGWMIGFVSLPFFLQRTVGLSPAQTGLMMTPWPLATMISAPTSGWLSDRYSAGVLGAIGLGVFAVGLVALSGLRAGASTLDMVWPMALCGAGFGFFQSPNNRAMLSEAPLNRSGAAGGMLGTARTLGQSGGAVVVAFLLSASPQGGVRNSFVLAAVLALFGAVASASRIRRRPADPRKDVAAI